MHRRVVVLIFCHLCLPVQSSIIDDFDRDVRQHLQIRATLQFDVSGRRFDRALLRDVQALATIAKVTKIPP